MSDYNEDMLPDWLRDSYQQQGATPTPGTGPLRRPSTGNLQPETPPSKPVSRRLGLDSPARSDNAERLSIKNYLLEGNPGPALAEYLNTDRMFSDNILLRTMYDAIEETEKQIVLYVRNDDNQELPDRVDSYKTPEIAVQIGEFPVQLASVIADTILLTAGEIATCPKKIRNQAVFGIAQRIVNTRKQVTGNLAASIRVTKDILGDINRGAVPPADRVDEIKIHARKLFLFSVIEEYERSQREDKLPGSSWLG